MTQIDETDRAILTLLAENARMPVTALAKRLGLARTTVQARLDRMEGAGVIRGYRVPRRSCRSSRGPALRCWRG